MMILLQKAGSSGIIQKILASVDLIYAVSQDIRNHILRDLEISTDNIHYLFRPDRHFLTAIDTPLITMPLVNQNINFTQ